MLILARKRPLKHILLALMALMLVEIWGCDGHRLLVAAGGAFHSGFAARGVFRSRFHCGGQAGGRGEARGRIHYDSGHDGCQSVRRSAGHFHHILSWRVTFLLVACWGVIVLYYMAVGSCGGGTERYRIQGTVPFPEDSRSWLILGATALGNGGVFCWYSYITPLLTNVSGFSAGSVTACDAGRLWHGGGQSGERTAFRQIPRAGGHGGARHDLHCAAADIFSFRPIRGVPPY